MAAAVAAKVVKAAELLAPMDMSAVIVWEIAHRAMASALNNSVIAPHVAMIVPHATAIAHKASALLVNSTTGAHAMTAHVHRATLTHRVRHAVTMTTSSLVPMHTWAPKVA